ncbi:hypothetical protein AQUCO_02800193v1 [Aquilegia coerulea]|uniref:Uncharacterized protein n=1 Tax=Aquilegia coerulea TaxID=218851 RepID=A0A2G5D4A9_AQUCA|nr:hypothetical protein AQUCO_02800193v1 [Aquilegia coerulea]
MTPKARITTLQFSSVLKTTSKMPKDKFKRYLSPFRGVMMLKPKTATPTIGYVMHKASRQIMKTPLMSSKFLQTSTINSIRY